MTTKTTKTNSHADVLSRLDAIARNLWWSWQPDAQRLFASLDPRLWEATHHNPIKTIRPQPEERMPGRIAWVISSGLRTNNAR